MEVIVLPYDFVNIRSCILFKMIFISMNLNYKSHFSSFDLQIPQFRSLFGFLEQRFSVSGHTYSLLISGYPSSFTTLDF